ncbi:MAG: EutN/CcmL family microcompartment protein [Defluviitaleaceae bacterium]|nr:EutN/CcmL family microcompartment protein [Defluviitaleaceae bacterium]
MQICKVVGTVVSTNKTEKLSGMKLLLVRAIDLETWEEKGPLLVSVDTVSAGVGEVVMTVGGSSSRQTEATEAKPVDNSIVAIIDHIDVGSKRVFDRTDAENKT